MTVFKNCMSVKSFPRSEVVGLFCLLYAKFSVNVLIKRERLKLTTLPYEYNLTQFSARFASSNFLPTRPSKDWQSLSQIHNYKHTVHEISLSSMDDSVVNLNCYAG